MKKQVCKWCTPWRCAYASPRRSLLAEYHTVSRYSKIASTKSPSTCVTTDASLIKLTALFSSHMIAAAARADEYWHFYRSDCKKNTLPRAYQFAHSPRLITPAHTLSAFDAGCFVELHLLYTLKFKVIYSIRIYGFSWIDLSLNSRIFNTLCNMCNVKFHPNWPLNVESASLLLGL
jgi:hypothetical protein